MFWILIIVVAIIFFFLLILKSARKQTQGEIKVHQEYTEKNNIDVSQLIKTGKYLVGFPSANKVVDKTCVGVKNESLILYNHKYSGYALGISSIDLNNIQNLYIDNFYTMNERIIENGISFNESYFVRLSQIEQNLPYYVGIDWLDQKKINHIVFIFEGRDSLMSANRSVNELSEHLNLNFSCGF